MPSATSLRRALATTVGVCSVFLAAAGPAVADDEHPPNCTTADMTGVMAGVSAAMSAYLFTHPDVNMFFTSLQGQSKEQIRAATQNYLDTNPQVRAELDGIRQPSTDFRTRCNIPQRAVALGVV